MSKYDLYEDYMCNQPMSDGKEIRDFFDDIELEEKRRIAMIENQIKKGCDKCSQWDEYFGCDKCERI